MRVFRIAVVALLATLATLNAFAAVSNADPLAAVDLNRNAIIADIVQGFDGDRAALARRLAGLRADRLLSASLASTRESLESILAEAEKSRDAGIARAGAKVLGSPNSDLVYTPISPCRLIDTRGFGAPIQGGAFTPNQRRAYVPAGQCGLPVAGVASVLISFTTQNLTPTSGGYLAILGPGAPVSTTVDIFNFNAEWSASNTAVATGPAAQFDAFVNTASAHLVVDILGYFAPPTGTVVKSITAGTGLTGGTITDTGTVALATAYQLPQACTNGQVPRSNGAGVWSCVTAATGTVTFVGAGTGLTGGSITSTGQVAIDTPYQLPQTCLTGQVAQWLGGGVWGCVTPSTPTGGTVTGVTASPPLASSGGIAPDISLAGIVNVANGGTGQISLTPYGLLFGNLNSAVGTVAAGAPGQVLGGTFNAPTWSDTLSLNGNIDLLANFTDASHGGIVKGGEPFLHDFGANNIFVGMRAGNFTLTGIANTAIGEQAMKDSTSGSGNTAVGTQALFSNTSASFNTAAGFEALGNNLTGNSNTAIGSLALLSNTTGPGNVAIGDNALTQNTSGGRNIAIGTEAGLNLTTGSNNIVIGNAGTAGESDTIRIGTSPTPHSRTFIAGIRGITTQVPNAIAVLIDSDGQLGTVSSSRRFKDDIADMDASTDALMKLRPVTFHYKTDQGPSGRTLQYGLIAEEVAEVYPGLVAHSADGEVETVMYQYLPPMLLNEVQKQQRTIEAQAREIAQLKRQSARVDAQAQEIAELKLQSARMALALERLAPVNIARQ